MDDVAAVSTTAPAAAAESNILPPSTTPTSSGKKRKRSEASVARDKLVGSKKYQTYKLYELLQRCGILDDPSELDRLKNYIHSMLVLREQGWEQYAEDLLKTLKEAKRSYEEATRSKKEAEERYKRLMEWEEKQNSGRFTQFLKWKAAFKDAQCELLEEKMGLMEDRDELQKEIAVQRQWEKKYEKVYAEVKELRKLKYAQTRKEKGPVGVVRQ